MPEDNTAPQEHRSHAGETVQPEAAASPFPTFTFGVVMEQAIQTITFPGMEPKWFVRAKAPDAKGARKIAGASLVGRQTADMEDEAELRSGAYEVYLAKCEQQIVGFVLPNIGEDGTLKGELSFDGGNSGRNDRNRNVYDHLNAQTATYLEGALDHVAGRDTERAKEYLALKNG